MFTRRIRFRRVTIPTVASDSNWIDYIVASDGAIGMHGIIDIGALIASILNATISHTLSSALDDIVPFVKYIVDWKL